MAVSDPDDEQESWFDFPGMEPRGRPRPVRMGAEYRYVPHSGKVLAAPVQPGDSVYPLSLSKPVPGGLSGRIHFDLVAETPVLFGEAGRTVPLPERFGTKTVTEHARLWAGGPYAAPGRAIKGLLRSVYGIVTCSHFQPFNGDHRFASRQMDYIERFGSRVTRDRSIPPNAGWLTVDVGTDGELEWRIVANYYTHIESNYILDILTISEIKAIIADHESAFQTDILEAGIFSSAHAATSMNAIPEPARAGLRSAFDALWQDLGFAEKAVIIDHLTGAEDCIEIARYQDDGEAITVGGRSANHYLLSAGAMSGRTHDVLIPYPSEKGDPVDADIIRAFLYANSEYAKDGVSYREGDPVRYKPSGHLLHLLADYLSQHDHGREIARRLGLSGDDLAHYRLRSSCVVPGVPVYLAALKGGLGYHLGLSQVIPVPPKGAVRDFLDQDALPEGRLDWADALFGRVSADGQSQASRLKFGFALACDSETEMGTEPAEAVDLVGRDEAIAVIQGQPKVSYDPLTLSRREPAPASIDQRRITAVSWAADPSNARLNGYRRYPAVRKLDEVVARNVFRLDEGKGREDTPRTVTGEEITNSHAFVRPLRAGVTYRCEIDFHNLHPLELGGLLWSISFGDPEAMSPSGNSRYRHVAGRLRNKGFGRLRPARVRLEDVVENPMPPSATWQAVLGTESSEADLASELVGVFEACIGKKFAAAEGFPTVDDRNELRRKFYEHPTITSLINTSDSEWSDGRTDLERDKLFNLPPVRWPGGRENEDYFKNFSNLRRHIYKGRLPSAGRKTVLDEFLTPVPDIVEVSVEQPDSVRLRFADPAKYRADSRRFAPPG